MMRFGELMNEIAELFIIVTGVGRKGPCGFDNETFSKINELLGPPCALGH